MAAAEQLIEVYRRAKRDAQAAEEKACKLQPKFRLEPTVMTPGTSKAVMMLEYNEPAGGWMLDGRNYSEEVFKQLKEVLNELWPD